MSRQKGKRSKAAKKDTGTVAFKTAEEVSSHFFPQSRPEAVTVRGKERGAKAAESAFTEIAKRLEA